MKKITKNISLKTKILENLTISILIAVFVFIFGVHSLFAQFTISSEKMSGEIETISTTSADTTVLIDDNAGSLNTVDTTTTKTSDSTSSGTSNSTTTNVSNTTFTSGTSNTTFIIAPDTTPPSMPTELRFSDITTSSFTLKWDTSVDPDVPRQLRSGLLGYRIYKDNGTANFLYSSNNFVNISNLKEGSSHTFRVLAFDARGNVSPLSDRVSVTLLNKTVDTNPDEKAASLPLPLPPPTPEAIIYTPEPIIITEPVQEEIVVKSTPSIDMPETPKTMPAVRKLKTELSKLVTPPAPLIVPTSPVFDSPSISPETSKAVERLQNVTASLNAINTSIEDNKQKLLRIVDDHISTTVNSDPVKNPNDLEFYKSVHNKISNDIDSRLNVTVTSNPEIVKQLKSEISDGLNEINRVSLKSNESNTTSSTTSLQANNVLDTLASTLDDQSNALKEQGGALLHKDSNNDGISDYDSAYLYNIDPIKPSIVTEFEGRKITAGEKILLGYDPAQKDLVKTKVEEPSVSSVPVTPLYKVNDVKLTEQKQIVMRGQALPNSWVTIYIYSTPVIVVVKTDDNGEWEYTLDKELETGEHKIYLASVSNSGKIVAKSSGFGFVKVAESATLIDTASTLPVSSEITKPGLLNNNIYLIVIIFISIIGLSIGLIGINSKSNIKTTEQDQNPEN